MIRTVNNIGGTAICFFVPAKHLFVCGNFWFTCSIWKILQLRLHRLLVEICGEAALSERSCCEWFQKFKNGEFDIEDKERSGRPKVYEDAELEALLDQDSCQTQEEQYDVQYTSNKT